MAHAHRALTSVEIETRRRNARKSTGPRTEAGKRRSSLNALKHGCYSVGESLRYAMEALGEDPEEFERLLRNLIAARRPADAVEMLLVEDIAVLVWKKARLDRAQAGTHARSLEQLEQERHRQMLQIGRDTSNNLQAEVLKTGLRGAKPSPAKFREMLSYLELLLHSVERKDFTQDPEPLLRLLYGEQRTLRGAQIASLFDRFRQPGGIASEEELLEAQHEARAEEDGREEPAPEDQDLLQGLRVALLEESRDVTEEYEMFLREHVKISRSLRHATLAPTASSWNLMIRYENALNRQIERKLRLLAQIQARRTKPRRGFRSGNPVEKKMVF